MVKKMKSIKNKTTFLDNKFCVPENELSTLPRQHLFEKLNQIKSNKWCSISAPAGFGKSSLVVSWLSTQELSPVWFNIESRDNIVEDFWFALVTAFASQGYITNSYHKLCTGINEEIGCYEWINNFFNEVCELSIDTGRLTVLVLDDMHTINNEEIISSVARLLKFLPPELSVMLISRETMPKAITSLKLSNSSIEITAQDLSFTHDQCLAYAKLSIQQYPDKVNEPHCIDALKDKVARIFQQTDGWPVFVCFAMQRLFEADIGSIEAHNFIAQDDIYHYIEQHIYDGLTLDMKKSLVGLAPYNTFNKSFYQDCLALPIEFDQLIKFNGFLVSRSISSGFMRLREPLRHFLISLYLEKSQTIKDQNFETAYEWYVERNMIIEAILLSLEYGRWLVSIDLIEQESEYLLTSSRCSEICTAFDTVPQEFITDRPVLLTFMARYFYHQVTHAKVNRYVEQAKSSILDDQYEASSINKYTHRSKEQLLNDIEQLKHWVGGLLNEGSGGYYVPKTETRPQCSDDKISEGLMCGLYYLSIGKIPKAQGLLESVLKKALADGHHTVLSKSLIALGWVCYLSGDFARLNTILSSVKVALASPGSAIYSTTLKFDWIMALALLEQGNFSQAERILQENSFHKNIKDAPMDVKFESLMMQVITSIELNNVAEAEKIFEDLDILSFELPRAVQQCFFSIPALKAQLYLKQGCLEKATYWIERLVCSDKEKSTITHQHECLVKVDVLIAQGQLDDAIRTLTSLKQSAYKSGNLLILMKANISESIALQARQQEEKSLASFHHAIQLGKQMGSVSAFLQNSRQMSDLLNRAKSTFHYPAYIGGLITELNYKTDSTLKNGTNGDRKQEDKCPLAALTKREREVLELMATGISNPEIAKYLCRSLGTIKIHVHNIYQKLGVSNRIKALNKYLAVLPRLNNTKVSKNSMQF
jgi:LuxR family maltose regulon positive regulatory protein